MAAQGRSGLRFDRDSGDGPAATGSVVPATFDGLN